MLEVPLDVVQNVLLAQNVPMTRHVRIRNVSILVQIHVDKTPNVESTITVLFVIVWMGILEILSPDVIHSHVRI